MHGVFEDALKKRNIKFSKNVKTADISTFRIGGPCRYFVEPQCPGELIDTVLLCEGGGLPYTVVGRCSNILFADGVIEQVLISTLRLDAVFPTANGLIADCGVMLPRLAGLTAARGFADLSFAAGIPGTLGGGLVMNAGAHEKSLGSLVEWVKVYFPDTEKIRTLFNDELSYSYRNSAFKSNNMVALRAKLTFCVKREPALIAAEIKALQAKRTASQPLNLPSAGSVFLRTPDGVSMGKIIDELGLKGLCVGNAAISEKHAGFIVNLGGATSADVQALIAIIKEKTQKERGIMPITEIRIIGEDNV